MLKLENNSDNEPAVSAAADVLRRGGLVVFPTDTVYGIAVANGNRAALDRLYKIKGRGSDKKIVILAASPNFVKKACKKMPPTLRLLAEHFWPGPLTIVIGDGENADAYRVPNHRFAISLIFRAGGLLRVTSANASGQEPALDLQSLDRNILKNADMVIDGGKVLGGVPSTVCRMEKEGYIKILRSGAISGSKLEKVPGIRVM